VGLTPGLAGPSRFATDRPATPQIGAAMSAPPSSSSSSPLLVGPARGPVLTTRDLAVLTWIGQQRAVTLEQVAVLLARHKTGWVPGEAASASPQRDPGRVTRGRARKRVAAWRARGLAVQGKLVAHHDTVVWLTQHGLDSMGLGWKARPHGPVLQHLTHTLTVAALRLHLEAHEGWGWRSEAQLQVDYDISSRFGNGTGRHLPDGLAIAPDGSRWALEAELSVKQDTALDRILFDLTDTAPDYRPAHDQIVYYVTEATRRPVERAIERLDTSRAARMIVRGLPDGLVIDPRAGR
jgi:hypothetical protein